jgi:hypothetical protein
MDTFAEILKYTLPSVTILITTGIVFNRVIRNLQLKAETKSIKPDRSSIVLPLRLQAYERFTLLLERISPESLLLRFSGSNLNSIELQSQLLAAIRAEYEHNVSQQIYISSSLWAKIGQARNQVIQLINISARETEAQAPAIELSRHILGNMTIKAQKMMQETLQQLHAEVENLL